MTDQPAPTTDPNTEPGIALPDDFTPEEVEILILIEEAVSPSAAETAAKLAERPRALINLELDASVARDRYFAAADLGAADREELYQRYEAARETYVEACDSFREDPEPWWLSQDADDYVRTVGSL